MNQECFDIVNSLLKLAIENGASDIHIKSNKPAYLRISGKLQEVEMDPIKEAMVLEFIEQTVPQEFYDRWRYNHQIDYSYRDEECGRFRVNAFYQRSTPSIVFRAVNDTPPNFSVLTHDEETMKKLSCFHDGIVLVSGATGSGKSSTLAAMLNYINSNFERHVITLEDPIEFTYQDNKSIFNQREIGIDSPSFAKGLEAALRQDPDVILVGEMRDYNTVDTTLQAAETGHFVMASIHAANARQTLQRFLDFFPPDEQAASRRQLSESLRATLTQKLIPGVDANTRVPVVELLLVDSLAREIIRDGEFEKVAATIDAGKESGSKSFNRDLYRLVKAGLVTKDDALAHSPNPGQLEMNLKGIFLSEGGIVQ